MEVSAGEKGGLGGGQVCKRLQISPYIAVQNQHLLWEVVLAQLIQEEHPLLSPTYLKSSTVLIVLSSKVRGGSGQGHPLKSTA